MKEVIFKLIDKYIQGYEIYETDKMYWLVNPETNEWVIYLSKNGDLWYYYYFFEKIYRLFSLDVVENQHYITEWVEDILQKGVKHTRNSPHPDERYVEDVIQKGVKHTESVSKKYLIVVEDRLQKAVRHTPIVDLYDRALVENILQNGVKQTKY